MLRKDVVKKLLVGNIPLLGILVGVMLISISIGPFQNWDTNYEFQAAIGVVKWGMPHVNNFGVIVNQPPVGFYIEALFFRIFGATIGVGHVAGKFNLGSEMLY